jgi:uncharacterized protein
VSAADILLLFATGLSAGFIDAIAGGGGLITMPVLIWFGLSPHDALGTNKAQSTFGTTLAVARYYRAGLIEKKSMHLPVTVTFIAAALGTWTVGRVSADLLRVLVPWLLLAVAAYTLFSPGFGLRNRAAMMSPHLFALLVGAVLGFYDGFFGPGAGSFWTLACIILLGYDLSRATGYTKAVNLASNVAALIVFAIADSVRYDIALVMIAGQLVGAHLGSGLAIKHGAGFIRVVFIAVAVSLTGKILWDQM